MPTTPINESCPPNLLIQRHIFSNSLPAGQSPWLDSPDELVFGHSCPWWLQLSKRSLRACGFGMGYLAGTATARTSGAGTEIIPSLAVIVHGSAVQFAMTRATPGAV